VIEAVELDPSQELFHVEQSQAAHRGQFVLGVQWHPERSFDISATSRALFARLVAESRAVAGR
jgi:putative glutamine amidotransferase